MCVLVRARALCWDRGDREVWSRGRVRRRGEVRGRAAGPAPCGRVPPAAAPDPQPLPFLRRARVDAEPRDGTREPPGAVRGRDARGASLALAEALGRLLRARSRVRACAPSFNLLAANTCGQDSTCAKKALKNVCRPRPRPRPRHPCSEALTPPACAPPRPRALASPLSVRAALPQITSRPTPSLGPCANVSTASASQILLLKIAGSPSVTALSLPEPGRLLLSAAPQPPGVTAARDRDRCCSQRLPAPPPMPRWEGGPLKAAVFLVFHC